MEACLSWWAGHPLLFLQAACSVSPVGSPAPVLCRGSSCGLCGLTVLSARAMTGVWDVGGDKRQLSSRHAVLPESGLLSAVLMSGGLWMLSRAAPRGCGPQVRKVRSAPALNSAFLPCSGAPAHWPQVSKSDQHALSPPAPGAAQCTTQVLHSLPKAKHGGEA